ncbi:hypothetical protein H0I39_08810 [Ottowia beijingensis]|uniref:Uncharacterized protein n=1 Tax=Ottowia beijingensis TaxID=1207057 RepID=A0A853IXQ8_9BURK|nr:hypothetical protein [Ottowia beijingensis]NZA01828.1 hypothetical protein [Ottowia beijingensis]
MVPLRALHAQGSRWTDDDFAQRRRQWQAEAAESAWVRAMAGRDDLDDKLARGGLTLHWSPSIRVLSDPPEKAAPWPASATARPGCCTT